MTDQFQRLKRDGLGWIGDLFKGHERRLKALEGLSPDQLGGTQGRIVVVENKAESAADAAQNAALEAQQASLDSQQATLDAQQAQLDALQAKVDAANAQEQATQLEQSIAQPGVNKFDTAPIAAQNIAGYDTINLTEYNWVPDGIQVRTPPYDGSIRGVNIFTRDLVAVRPGDVLTYTVGLDFSSTAGGASLNDVAQAGFGFTFYNSDGSAQSASVGGGSSQTGLYKGSFEVPPAAVSVRINLYAYIPNDGVANPESQVWVKFRGPYLGVLVGTDGLADGAVTAEKLDPSLEFGVADNSLTTAKYQDASVTDAKIANFALSKGTGTVSNAQIANGAVDNNKVASGIDAGKLAGFIAAARIAANTIARSMLSAELQTRIRPIGSFRNIIDDSDSTVGWQSLPNNTWTILALPPLTGYTRKNNLNDGAAATLASDGVVAPFTGRYSVRAQARHRGNVNGTARGLAVTVANGARQMEENNRVPANTFASFNIPIQCGAEVEAVAGDVIRVVAVQNSGTANDCRLETLTVSYEGP